MQEIKKKRGGCLTAWLILILIANLWIANNHFISLRPDSLLPIPQWVIFILMVGSILNIVFAVAILRWKRWGVYGFGVIAIVLFIIDLTTGRPLYIAPLGLVGIIVLLILLRPVWKYLG